MNEELQKALGEILGKANNGIDAASDFLIAELPDVIQQLLTWYMVQSLFISLVLIMSVPLTIRFFNFFKRKRKEQPYEMWDIGVVFTCIYWLVIIVPVISNVLEAMKIWIAPKIWLLEYAAKLTN